MLSQSFLSDKSIQPLIRTYKPEEVIFQQGAIGTKMYIIVEGFVRVYQANDSVKYLISILSPGEVLGEKAILTESQQYTRNFTAQAKTSVSLIEIGPDALQVISAKWPDFYLRVLKMVEDRLDKSNELSAILRSNEPIERVVGYLLYFDKHITKKMPTGFYVNITGEEVRFATNVEPKTVEWILNSLSDSRILSRLGDGFVLADHKRLVEYQLSLLAPKAKAA